MTPFESLMRDRKIRLETAKPFQFRGFPMYSVCRGWLLAGVITEPILTGGVQKFRTTFEFDHEPPFNLRDAAGRLLHPPADFDAMLAALEPYEVIGELPPEPDAVVNLP